jgi:RNA polymerase sigma-70 factor, ECF subfamily
LIVEPLPDEGAVVERILAGDREAFGELVSRYHRVVFSVAYRMTGTRAEAEDLCQDVFLSVYQNLNRFDRGRPLGPWLRKITCNRALNHLRRRHLERGLFHESDSEPAGLEPADANGADPAERLARSERADRLGRAMEALPPRQRLAVTLKYVEELTADEIAQALNAPRNTVKTWLLRARETLRRELADEL